VLSIDVHLKIVVSDYRVDFALLHAFLLTDDLLLLLRYQLLGV
jgi:hypothetical protein